jgi:mRNA-degrading endonuclease HigB of HigAB toxin-antitoxin module
VRADRIVFSIKGNSYRRVAAVDFEKGIVWIKWIGTHRIMPMIRKLHEKLGISADVLIRPTRRRAA